MSADASTPASGAAGIGIGPMGARLLSVLERQHAARAVVAVLYEALPVQTAELPNRGKCFLAPTRDCVFPESCWDLFRQILI